MGHSWEAKNNGLYWWFIAIYCPQSSVLCTWTVKVAHCAECISSQYQTLYHHLHLSDQPEMETAISCKKMQLCDDCMVLLVQQVVFLECHILSWSSLSIFCCIFMVKLFVYILCRTPLNCSSYINLPVVGKPSCLQTTIACLISKAKSHTVPHAPLEQSSTRPSIAVVPPTSLTSPVEQGIPDTERK